MSLPPLEAEAPAAFLVPEAAPGKAIHGRSPTKIAFDRLRNDKVAVVSFVVVMFFVFIAVFAPLLARAIGVEYDAGRPSEDLILTNGMPNEGPPFFGFTWDHPLGKQPRTGDDNLANWLYGARTSLEVAGLAAVATTVIGITIGLMAGYSRGWLDRVLSFIIDLFLSFPFLLGALALAPILINRFADDSEKLGFWQFWSLIFVLTIFGWMYLARLVRGEVLSLREREFILSARAIGVPTRAVLLRELLPNLIAPIVVSFSLGLPAFVAAEAGLAYLGIGLTGQASWGQTIQDATAFFKVYPLFLWAPVVGIMALVVALNLLGDSIRDAFDPKTRR